MINILKNRPIGIGVKGYKTLLKPNRVNISGSHGQHLLIISGYECKKNRFVMRNSWGNAKEYVGADDLIEKSLGSFYLK